jgi:dephospho-CoA kinase
MIVGITGLIGSGKSLVGEELNHVYGLDVKDCDNIAHDFYGNAYIVNQIERMVGKHRCADDSFDRKSLLRYLIKNPTAIKYINDIIHPPVIEAVRDMIVYRKSKNNNLVVLTPLLFECGMEKLFDATVYIYTDHAIRIRRLIDDRHLNRKQIDFFDNLQISADKKFSMCDYILLNNGHESETCEGIKELFYKIF